MDGLFVALCTSCTLNRVAWRLQNFQTGDVSSFLLRTPENLGVPVFFRVWHDNTGEGDKAGWFLAKVIVVDRQTKQWCVNAPAVPVVVLIFNAFIRVHVHVHVHE